MQSVDVAIVGGGMVGLAVACGLQGSGLRVAVLEQRVPEPLAADAPPQLRVSAINAASEKLLTRLGVWQDILSRRASCYHGMEVWDKDSFGHISFDDQSMGYSHLGHIVENSVIHYALWNKAQQSSDITLLAPAELQQVAWGENETFLTLKDGSMLTARLVIGADGANSWLRNKADIPLTFWDYQHHALVATIRTENRMMRWRGRFSMAKAFWPFYRLAIRIFAQLSGHCRQRKRSGCSRQVKMNLIAR